MKYYLFSTYDHFLMFFLARFRLYVLGKGGVRDMAGVNARGVVYVVLYLYLYTGLYK